MSMSMCLEDDPARVADHIVGQLSTLTLTVERESPNHAREWLRAVWHAHSLPDVENAALCITELTTNVYRHVRRSDNTMRLVIYRYPDRIRVDVYDQSDTPPKMRKVANFLDDEGEVILKKVRQTGNGLCLVEATADDWGAQVLNNIPGKCVWFAIDLSG